MSGPVLIPAQVVEWLTRGEVGVSSCAIAEHMSGAPVTRLKYGGWSHRDDDHPHDPDDLRRCVLLLDRIPAWRSDIARMATRSACWAALVSSWPELEGLLAEEMAAGDRAPKTYARMRALLEPVER